MRRLKSTLVLILLTFVGGTWLYSKNLSVDVYIQLSVARLQLVRDTLEQKGRGPTHLELEALCSEHGTTTKQYLAFRSANRKEVESYLASHPEINDKIKSLSARIDELIKKAEEN